MKKHLLAVLLGLLSILTLRSARAQQPGGLDPSFAPAQINLGVQQIIAQAGGKAVVAGHYTTINGTAVGPVVRLKADGTLDPDFANANLDYIPAGDTQVNSIAIASGSDGKIYVALNTTPSFTATLVRLNANGTTDTNFHTTVDGAPNAMVVQPNGQVVIAGSFSTLNGVSVNGCLARLEPDGSTDSSFDTSPRPGAQAIQFTFAYELAVQADGKFLVGGVPSYTNSSVIARLNTDGSLDSSFFINSVDNGSLDAFTLQPDGNLVIGYNTTTLSGTTAPYTVRLLTHSTDGTDGQVDPSFQPNNAVTAFPYNIVAQADGKLVYSVGTSIFRLNADGSPDRTFTLGVPSNSTNVIAYAQSTDGNLLAAGQVLINDTYVPGIARLFSAVPGGATAVSVVVPGNANIWLARDGSTDEADLVPIQQPVRVVDLALTAGATLSFTNVTGAVNYAGGAPTDGPDGLTTSPENHAAENGISGVNAPLDGLVGVFIDDSAAGSIANPPATLDFSGAIGLDFTALQPALGQVFFIGDGLTSSGATQQFTVPAGATHLVLGTVDGLGWYNNTGAFSVTVNASAGGGTGGSNGIVVPGTANPWLARDGSTDPKDTLANAGPVRVPNLTLTPGATLSFSATGLVSIYAGTPAYASPDGDAGSPATHPAENGVSGVTVDYNSLVGVFIDDTPAGSATAPADLDFVNSGGVPGGFDYTTLQPALGQMFFIGDGKTSGGASQQVTVPAGATHLVLGVTDTDMYNDNAGAFTVTVTSSGGGGGGGGGGTGGGSLVVPGTANVWLAGQENGIFASNGADQAPTQSPVQVPNLTLDPNKGLVFSVGGTVNLGGGSTTQYSPDGNFFVTHAAENGIAGTKTHQGALIGVFLNDNTPGAASVPGDLDYSIGAGVSASSYSPQLQQAFFIGDGEDTLTRTQTFYPPAGATRLFLGVMDNTAFSDNTGSFSVGVSTSSINPGDLSVSENVTSSSTPGGNGSFALVGDVLTYTFTVRNSGKTAFTNAYVHDVLPSYIDLSKTVVSDGGTVDSSIVTWSLGTLAPGATVTRTLQVTLANNAPLGIHLTNPGYSATADGLPDVAGRDRPDTLIESAVSVKITNNTATGKPGGVVRFVYDLTNTTPEAFKKLTLTVPFLPGLSYHAVYFADANGNQLPVDTKGKKVASYDQQSNSAVFTLNSLAGGGEMFLVLEATVAYNFNPVGLVSLPGAQITISKYTNGQPITLALDDSSSALSGQPADAPPKLVFGKSVVTGDVAAILLAANPNTAALLNATTLKPFLDLNPNQKAVAKLGNFTSLAALTTDQITQVFNPFVGSDTDPDTNAAVSTVPEPTASAPNPFVTFGLAFSNTGSGKATSVTVYDSAPKGLVIDRDSFFVNGVATPQSAIQFNDDGSYAITTKNLKPGKGGLIFYRAKVLAPADPPNGVPVGGYIEPTSAQLTIENLDDEVIAPAPDHLLLTGPAHASVSSTQTGDTTIGSNVTYTILYKNDGGQTIQDFRVVSPVPPGGAFQSAQFLGLDQQTRVPNTAKGELLATPGAGATSGLTVFHLGKVKTRGLGLVQVVYQMTSAVLKQPNQALVHQPYVTATGGLPTANGLSERAPVRRQLSGIVTRDTGDTSVGAAAAPNTSRPTNNPNGPHLGMTVACSQTVNTGDTVGYTVTAISLGNTDLGTFLPFDPFITFAVPVPSGAEYAGITGGNAAFPSVTVTSQVQTGSNGQQYVTGYLPALYDGGASFVTVSLRAKGAAGSILSNPDIAIRDNLSGTDLHSGPIVTSVLSATDYFNSQRMVLLNTLSATTTTTFNGANFQQRVDQVTSKSRFTAVINADYLSLNNGVLIIPTINGNIVAQGGGNIVAQGGGNIVAQGGGNIVAQGGGNIVAQGGGNIVAQGGGNLISVKNIVDDKGQIISQDGSTIANLFAGIVAQGGGNIVAQGGGNIVAQGGGNLQSVGVGVISNDGGSFAASPDKALAISQADLASFGQLSSLNGDVFRSESGSATLMTSGFAAAVAGGAIKIDGIVKGTNDNLSLSNVTSQGNVIRGGSGIVAQGGGN